MINRIEIRLKLDSYKDTDLAAFTRVLTDNGYTVCFDKRGTKALMCTLRSGKYTEEGCDGTVGYAE